MSSFTAVNRMDLPFNVSMPARLGSTFVYVDEENDLSAPWCPHPDLEPGIRNRLVSAVSRNPTGVVIITVNKRMMTGTEAAVRDTNAAEAIANKLQREKEAVEAAETLIDNEKLVGFALEDDGDHSSVREIVFSTSISPPRGTMLPPPRPVTSETEAARKRSFTLVHRTPEKPREAPVAPSTPLNTIARETSPVASTPQEPAEIPTEIPASTAPARLDGRTRREGKDSRYDEAMAIQRGRGGGGRGGRGGGRDTRS